MPDARTGIELLPALGFSGAAVIVIVALVRVFLSWFRWLGVRRRIVRLIGRRSGSFLEATGTDSRRYLEALYQQHMDDGIGVTQRDEWAAICDVMLYFGLTEEQAATISALVLAGLADRKAMSRHVERPRPDLVGVAARYG